MALPGDSFGPYRLRHLIGSGGMGQVFAAVHERLEQEVALKLLSPAAAQERQLVARFIQEARALAQLQHPGVVRVFHCDLLDDGTVYLAMERLEGISLRDWMRSQCGPAPLEASLAIGRQIADAMADVHSKGIVHRDLKPENVFLCPDSSVAPGYRTKLLDFGIAKVPPAVNAVRADTQVQTVAPIFIGTATYMAPEQCRNASEVDGRADVYALGVLLFELLAGQPPFVSDEHIEVVSMKIHEEPPPLRDFAPELPGALSAFVASMLAKEPVERPTMLRCSDMLGRSWARTREECPIPGLAPFTDAQSELFFGRKQECDELLGLLEQSRTGGRRWVQLEGPSGAGKSSLVQAGLLPRLKESSPQEPMRWRVASMRPSHAPLRGLAQALVTASAETGFELPLEDAERALRTGPDALRALVMDHTPPGCCFLLVLEQMEELFTLGASDCSRLDELVATALAAPECPLRLLTTVRSDFIHRLEQMPRLARQLNQAARYHLRAMEEEALTQVIQGMAQRAGLRLSEGLPERMVHDASSEGSRLPLLGHALHSLWMLRGGALLTHERYEQLGGVGGALARQAEQLLDSLGEEGRERAKWMLLDLVQVGRGVPDTRRPRSRREVLTAGGDGASEEILMQLSGMRSAGTDEAGQGLRLLVISGGPDPAQQRVDLVHETLLQKVPFIVSWIESERVLLERHAYLEVAAHEWEQEGCPREGLPSGSLLAHYREHTSRSHPRGFVERMTSDRAKRYLEVARRLDQRRVLRNRALILAAFVAVALIVLSAVRAEQSARSARLAQRSAEERLRQILRSQETFISKADWPLSRLLHTLELRRRMLRQHAEELAALPEEVREKPEVREAVVKTHHRRADLAYHDDSLAEAEEFLFKGLKEIRRGLEHHPENKGLMFQLGLNHSKLGKIALARSLLEEARGHFDTALEIFERLRPPAEADKEVLEDYWRTLATSYSEQGELALESGRLEAATALYDLAIEFLGKISQEPYEKSLLAETLRSRAEAARRAGDLKTARRHLEDALALSTPLVEREPGNGYYLWGQAWIHVELAALRTEEGLRDAAAAHHLKAQAMGHTLLQGEQVNKRYALVLLQSLLRDEELARARGNDSHAEQVRSERCRLVSDFVGRDGKDVRFQRLACSPGERPKK